MSENTKMWVMWAALLGALGVLLGAFGAHVLRPVLPLQMVTIFHTAVRYQLFHVLALLGVALLMGQYSDLVPGLRRVAGLFLAGVVLFSGSLYGVALTGIEWLGMITPLGGVCWIVAWIGLAWLFRPGRTGRARRTAKALRGGSHGHRGG